MIDPSDPAWRAVFQELKIAEASHASFAAGLEKLVKDFTEGVVREYRASDITPPLKRVSDLAEKLASALNAVDKRRINGAHPFLFLQLLNAPTPQGGDHVRYYRDEARYLAKAALRAVDYAKRELKRPGQGKGVRHRPDLTLFVEKLLWLVDHHDGEVSLGQVQARGSFMSLLDTLSGILRPGFFPSIDEKPSPLSTYKRMVDEATRRRMTGKKTTHSELAC